MAKAEKGLAESKRRKGPGLAESDKYRGDPKSTREIGVGIVVEVEKDREGAAEERGRVEESR